MVNFANGIVDRGIGVDCLVQSEEGPFRSILSDKVNVVSLGGGALRSVPKIRKYLRQDQPDILFSSLPHVNIAAILSKFWNRVPTKVVIREATTPSVYLKQIADTKQKFIIYLCKLLFRYADHVVGVCDDSRDDCIDFYGLRSEQITRVYSALATKDVFELAQEPVEHPWFQNNHRVIVSMGRVIPLKDFTTLINAFSTVRQKIDCKLMIVGDTDRDPNYYKRMKNLIRELDLVEHVDFIGFKTNPFPYLYHSEIYVLSSELEGLPGALVQGMALGCKLVSTNCKSGPREVLADGEYGQLVPIGDSRAMADGILTELSREQDRSIGRARSKQFTEDCAVENLLSVFTKTID